MKIDSVFIERGGATTKKFYTSEQLHELRSCSKLLTAMAVGIAMERQMFSLDTRVLPMLENVVEIKNKGNIEKIRQWDIRALLTHTTGYNKTLMSKREIRERNLDVNNLLSYVLNADIPNEVGSKYTYNNVEPFVISVFFQEKFGINLADFINENIFRKLNILDYEWDNYGKYCPGCTGLLLKHADFHKIGKLLLEDGLYNGSQVVPKKWIQNMCTKQIDTPDLYNKAKPLPKLGAGFYTFISRDGIVLRDGTNGQYIIVDKKSGLLITIMASEEDMDGVLKSVLEDYQLF